MVWRQLPKLIPAGSIPVSRSMSATDEFFIYPTVFCRIVL